MHNYLKHEEVDLKIQSIKNGLKEDIDNCIIDHYKFVDVKFEYMGLRNTIFINCIFLNAIFETVYFDNSSFKNCVFKSCIFSSIDFGMSKVIFDNTILYETNFIKTEALNSSFINTNFVRCIFSYFDVSGNLFTGCRIIECNLDGLIYSPEAFSDNNLFLPDKTKR